MKTLLLEIRDIFINEIIAKVMSNLSKFNIIRPILGIDMHFMEKNYNPTHIYPEIMCDEYFDNRQKEGNKGIL